MVRRAPRKGSADLGGTSPAADSVAKPDLPYSRAGQLWLSGEQAQLTSAFNAGATLTELVAQHRRTPYAIVGQLQRLGVIVLIGNQFRKVSPDAWALLESVEQLTSSLNQKG